MPPGRPCSGTHRSLPRPGKSDAAQRRNAAKTSCCLPLEREQLEWATLVVVMERRHRQALLRRHAAAMKGKRLVCLDIPDDYAYMQAELLHLLERKAGPFLRRD